MSVIATSAQLPEMLHNVREPSSSPPWPDSLTGDTWTENRRKSPQIRRHSGQKVTEVFHLGMETLSCVVDIMWKSLTRTFYLSALNVFFFVFAEMRTREKKSKCFNVCSQKKKQLQYVKWMLICSMINCLTNVLEERTFLGVIHLNMSVSLTRNFLQL